MSITRRAGQRVATRLCTLRCVECALRTDACHARTAACASLPDFTMSNSRPEQVNRLGAQPNLWTQPSNILRPESRLLRRWRSASQTLFSGKPACSPQRTAIFGSPASAGHRPLARGELFHRVSELETSIGADGNGFADGGQMTPTNCDVLIIGAGMAGVSAAAHLAPHMRVIVAEREAQPTYHATGRSAAMFTEIYGNGVARALTRASRDFLHHPPAGFSDSPLVARRGVMMVATPNLADALRAQFDRFRPLCPICSGWTPTPRGGAPRCCVPVSPPRRFWSPAPARSMCTRCSAAIYAKPGVAAAKSLPTPR